MMPSKGKNNWKLDQQRKTDKNTNNRKKPGMPEGFQFRFSLGYVLITLLAVSFFNYFLFKSDTTLVPYSTFKDKVRTGEIRRVEIDANYYTGYTEPNPAEPSSPLPPSAKPGVVYKTVPVSDPEFTSLLDEKGVVYSASPRGGSTILSLLLNWILPFAIMIFFWRAIMSKFMGSNSNVLAFGQNKATVVAEGDIKTRFADVAGVDEAKAELVEVVDFLKNPQKYTEIGGKIPKGVLLVGPPGTGKTLLARAVAGEANVPFFKMSGADFVEMFVGVGAARVRDLFKQAREKAPCIIFIDEIDALGKSRASGFIGGNDEREQTLNQLLVEMDGFDSTSGLIILAATNRPDVLDPALLRAGRFDRQVLVDKPDMKGREEILKIHTKNIKMDPSVDLSKIARSTPGFVGADLANVVNEAALLAVRAGRKKVKEEDFQAAIEKVIAGLEKKNRMINPKEKQIVAVHETGHAITAAFTPGADPVRKISIVPRGYGALGYTLQMPLEDRYLITEEELLGKIDVLLGGRAAEELVFQSISTGASNDIANATEIAKRMITDYGMSDKFKNVALTRRSSGLLSPQQASDPFATKEYSEETQRYIDETIASMINERYQHVVNMLTEKKYLLDHISSVLLEKEVIEESEFAELLEGGTSIPKKLQEPMVAAEAAHLPGATEKASISSASGK
ncbi:MAG TPA: ATP-dependent zinc metalloprotease FtsH [Rectinema sp.]|jgi:cell division protease FtsH|nr:ATP-dependent zinc metalloprotease FtsH [Spirochaetia bacterium]HAL93344.1 cell division protein FtsH [Spirochaetaceae bacterium]HNV18154.1 ATP-dependent zinc metalloprotease FtsH [Rectinema sp.]HNY98376.1 ATP-dependent zinc metalloprotease FtsH [Rectinema sp.]HOD57827.1 ATP-dependent zinc metalloprotease FtsH [Rectinema sp.]